MSTDWSKYPERYEGPIARDMPMQHRLNANLSTVRYADDWDIAAARLRWWPVRPAPDDNEAWARFVPTGPLPDTGPKVAKVGEVWAFSKEDFGATVALVETAVPRTVFGKEITRATVKTLAGKHQCSRWDSDGMFRYAVLLFPAETAAPVQPGAPKEPKLLPPLIYDPEFGSFELTTKPQPTAAQLCDAIPFGARCSVRCYTERRHVEAEAVKTKGPWRAQQDDSLSGSVRAVLGLTAVAMAPGVVGRTLLERRDSTRIPRWPRRMEPGDRTPWDPEGVG